MTDTQIEWKIDPATRGACLRCDHKSGLNYAGVCWSCHAEYTVYPETPIIRNPGKFEGCCRYVPYYWEVYLNGYADRDNGRILGFDISADDKAIFPELKRRQTVKLVETDQGFVCQL